MNISNKSVKPYSISNLDHNKVIWKASIPTEATIPLLQHQGEEASPLVKPGDKVSEGQLIGWSSEGNGIHASIPGLVKEIKPITLLENIKCMAVIIGLTGWFNYTGKVGTAMQWQNIPSSQIIKIMRNMGLVQLDGSVSNLTSIFENSLTLGTDTIVINIASGTPFLSSEINILQQYSRNIAEAVHIVQYILTCKNIYVVSTNKHLIRTFLNDLNRRNIRPRIQIIPSQYPAGDKHEIIKRISKGKANSTIVLNISTLFALYEAVVLKKPLIDKIITIGEFNTKNKKTVKTRIGTPIETIFQEMGIVKHDGDLILAGVPIKGHKFSDLTIPITKQINSLFILNKKDIYEQRQEPCINCGKCVEHCPAHLEPVVLHKLLDKNRVTEAREKGLLACWLCGICSHVCPSHIPLTRIMRDGILAASKEIDLEQHN